jgi:hypothetical protein
MSLFFLDLQTKMMSRPGGSPCFDSSYSASWPNTSNFRSDADAEAAACEEYEGCTKAEVAGARCLTGFKLSGIVLMVWGGCFSFPVFCLTLDTIAENDGSAHTYFAFFQIKSVSILSQIVLFNHVKQKKPLKAAFFGVPGRGAS